MNPCPSPSLGSEKSLRHTTSALLARRAGRAVADLRSWHHLERDLDITPLDLVLIAVELEEIEDLELQVDGLELAVTVGDALGFFSRSIRLARTGARFAHRPGVPSTIEKGGPVRFVGGRARCGCGDHAKKGRWSDP